MIVLEEFRLDRLFREVKEVVPIEGIQLLTPSVVHGVVPQSELGSRPQQALREDYCVSPAQPDDFVISMSSHAHGIEWCNLHGGISPDYTLLRPICDQRYVPFLKHALKSTFIIQQLGIFKTGVRMGLRLQWNKVRYCKISLPDVDYAVTTASFLDRETTRIDSLIEKKTRFIELLKEKRQAVVTQAVTKGLNSSAPMVDSGVEWLGLVPAHWKIMRCSNFLFEIKHKNDSLQSENYLSLMSNRGVIPYAEKGDVGNKKPEDLSKCKLVEVGDFVINSMNYSIGSYGRSNYRGICSPVYVILRHRKNFVESDYVDLILSNSSFQQYAQSFGTGILDHRRAIGWDEIKKISIAIPPIEEQIDISQEIHRETRKINSLIKKTEESISLLIEHRSALITAAVTGKIDVRNSK